MSLVFYGGSSSDRFKWGVRPVMELSLASFKKHSSAIIVCFGIWLLVVIYSFSPLVFH
jgi:hypothetical protein